MDQLSPAQSEAIAEALKSGRKVAAVKLYREFTGKGLAESKESVEQIGKRLGIPESSSTLKFRTVKDLAPVPTGLTQEKRT